MPGPLITKENFRDGGVGGAVFVEVTKDLMTDGGFGPNRRFRVDVGQTGFFAGRDFRTYKEYSIAAASSVSIKTVFPVDVIVSGLGLQVDEGHVHLRIFTGSTETDTFDTLIPVIGTNRMSERPEPFYEPLVTWFDGGTFTGGTELDLISVKTSGITQQSTTQDAAVAGERGIPAGTYYIRINNLSNDTATLIFRARWEERV